MQNNKEQNWSEEFDEKFPKEELSPYVLDREDALEDMGGAAAIPLMRHLEHYLGEKEKNRQAIKSFIFQDYTEKIVEGIVAEIEDERNQTYFPPMSSKQMANYIRSLLSSLTDKEK